MKHTTLVPCLAIAACAALPIAPRAAQAASRADADNKPKAAAPALSEDYRLGPGDKLRIEVYKDPQLSQSLEVRPDGKITLPLVGDIEATDRTPIELRDAIATSLEEYIHNPVVTVIVVEANAAQAYVMGEVARPGPVALSGPTTVLQALALAGGFKEFANTKHVKVLRRSLAGVRTIEFNYRDAIKGATRPVYLQRGDTVIVP